MVSISYQGNTKLVLTSYLDTNQASNTNNRKSTTRAIFIYTRAPISFFSKLQSIITTSSYKAKYTALFKTIKEAIQFRSLLIEIRVLILKPITIFKDNTTAIKLSKNYLNNACTKYINIYNYYYQE